MKEIAERLKVLRNSLGYSQKEIAAMLGTTQASINRYEHDQVTPPPEIILWYAEYFGVSLDYIYGRTDNTKGMIESPEAIAIKEQFEDEEKLRKFVEFCFEPGTAGNDRLKEVMVEMLGGNKPKRKKETSK